METNDEQSSRQRRSKTGCQTCRRRKVRCTEERPSCRSCFRLNLDCSYAAQGTATRMTKYRVRFHGAAQDSQTDSQADSQRPYEPRDDSTEAGFGLQCSGLGTAEVQRSSRDITGSEHFDDFSNEHAQPTETSHDLERSEEQANPGILDHFWDFVDLSFQEDIQMHLSGMEDIGMEDAGHGTSSHGPERLMVPAAASLSSHAVPGLAPNHTTRLEPANHGRGHDHDITYSCAETQLPRGGNVTTPLPNLFEFDSNDAAPLQHFLNTMTKFAKMQVSAVDNPYCTFFSTLALSHRQLYEAMMAWSSLHLAQTQQQSTAVARKRYETACTMVYRDAEPSSHLDLTLATVWFLLQYELLLAESVKNICDFLEHVTNLLRPLFRDYDKTATFAKLGPAAIRVIVWMSACDSRAALFGPVNAGSLLSCIGECPYFLDLVDSCNVVVDTPMTHDSNLREHEESPWSTVRQTVCTRIAMCKIKLLNFEADPREKERKWDAVDTILRSLRSDLEENKTFERQWVIEIGRGSRRVIQTGLSTERYNDLMLYATFYCAVMLYQEQRPRNRQSMSFDEFGQPSEYAVRVIRLAHQANTGRRGSPAAVWPHLLFHAAISCRDAVYQSWAVLTLKNAEWWGGNIRKTRLLLEQVLERQNLSDLHQDVLTVMEETTGIFVI